MPSFMELKSLRYEVDRTEVSGIIQRLKLGLSIIETQVIILNIHMSDILGL